MTSDIVEYKFNLTYRDEAETVVEEFFTNNRIHKRHGFRWHYFMHEALVSNRTKEITSEFCEGLEISHHPDIEKTREQYNQMLEDAYNEYKNGRYHLYHGVQLMAFHRLDEAAKLWRDYIKLEESKPVFDVALAWRNLSTCEPKNRLKFLKKSVSVKKTREAYLDLAIYYYEKEKWNKCYKYAKSGLKITKKTMSLLANKFAHGYLLDNLASVANHNRKMVKFSKNYKKNKRTMNVESAIAHNFKMFQD
jgi:tetratricopeptide (TPR) repeat protein